MMRNGSGESGDGRVNLSEADPENLRIPQVQPAEYQRGPQQGRNQNLLWELSRGPGELNEDVEPNPAQLDKLKGRIIKNDGNVRSSR